ncbi:MAG: class I SAM-dependent methyltransferase [Anaerolineales bacterium]
MQRIFSRVAWPYGWLTDNALWRSAAPDIAKQLPPSGARLRLLDMTCGTGTALRDLVARRPDITPTGHDYALGMLRAARERGHPGAYVCGDALRAPFPADTFDAVLIQRTYYFMGARQPDMLAEALRVLRPGGRLILVNPVRQRTILRAPAALRRGPVAALDMALWRFFVQAIGGVDTAGMAEDLRAAGFARILSEPIMDGWTILTRGEKPYADDLSTMERVAVGAGDAAASGELLRGEALQAAPGRYVHLLIRQEPNKPAWKLAPDEVITWHAAARGGEPPAALGFSSLPKAVAFMQAAVMAGTVRDVSKVAKFQKAVAAAWDFPIWLNPEPEALAGPVAWLAIDPASAEAPDE